jgi:hypothetical protein
VWAGERNTVMNHKYNSAVSPVPCREFPLWIDATDACFSAIVLINTTRQKKTPACERSLSFDRFLLTLASG